MLTHKSQQFNYDKHKKVGQCCLSPTTTLKTTDWKKHRTAAVLCHGKKKGERVVVARSYSLVEPCRFEYNNWGILHVDDDNAVLSNEVILLICLVQFLLEWQCLAAHWNEQKLVFLQTAAVTD